MRFLLAMVLVCLSVPAQAQSIWRQFFTTNPAPIVEVVPGSNSTVQFTTPNAYTRRYTINGMPGGGSGYDVAAGTNIVMVTNGNLVTISSKTDTNVINILLSTNISGYAGYATNAGNASWATNAGNASWATNAGSSTWATNAGSANWATNSGSATWATNSGSSTFATNAANATNFWGILSSSNLPPVLTNSTYASNVISGGQLPAGTVEANAGSDGLFLVSSNGQRVWSQNGGLLTNVPFAIFTNYALAPSSFTNVNGLAFGTGLYGMTSYWAYATVAGVGPIIIRYNGIDTNTVITTNGGSFSGAILDISGSSSAPSSNQLVTASWVRNLFNVGSAYYTANTVDINATNPASFNQVVYKFQSTIPTSFIRTYSTSDYLTNNGYIGSVVTTNTFSQMGGQIVVNAYLAYGGGSSTPTLKVHPEIYYSYDKTNWYGDYSAGFQSVVYGATNLYQWVVDFPTYTSTNASGFYVERRFKVDDVTGAGVRTMTFLGGTNLISGNNDASHITMQSPTANSGNAFLANNQTFTGNNTFTTGTRTFTHDSTHTVITNTGTLTSSEWNAGRQLEWYNGAVTMEMNKTNGVLTVGAYETTTNTLPFYTTIDCNKGYVFLSTNAAFTLAFSATYNATNDNQGLIVITNTAASTFVVTISGVNPPNSAVTFGCTNGQLTYLAWDRSRYHTNVLAWDTYKSVLK